MFSDNETIDYFEIMALVDSFVGLAGGALKKIAPSRGRREIFGGISCEKSRFYAKKSYFIHIAEGGAKFVGVFRVKNHDFTPKNHDFFPILGGEGVPGAPPPPLDPPLQRA